MAKAAGKSDIWAIVAAARNDSFRLGVTFLLDRFGVEYVLCEDVYSAVGELMRRDLCGSRGTRVLIVGSLDELGRDEMRFFEICRSQVNTRCCCLVRAGSAEFGKMVSAAIGAGVFIASSVKELEDQIQRLLSDWTDFPPVRAKQGKDICRDEFTLSADERKALLGTG